MKESSAQEGTVGELKVRSICEPGGGVTISLAFKHGAPDAHRDHDKYRITGKRIVNL